MATKFKFRVNRLNKIVDGYKVTDDLGLYLDTEQNLWIGCHLKTGKDLIGPSGAWKKKRACMSFIEAFVDFDWNVETDTEMYEKNGGVEQVAKVYWAAVERARGLE